MTSRHGPLSANQMTASPNARQPLPSPISNRKQALRFLGEITHVWQIQRTALPIH